MGLLTGADKENVPPQSSSSPAKSVASVLGPSPTSSPLKASLVSTPCGTPSKQRSISWTGSDIEHPHSDTVNVPPASSDRKLPNRSILKKTPAIVPMQQLVRPPTPEPEDPVNDPHYLQSPVLTLASSTHLDSEVSYADLREAYNMLAARVRVKSDPSTVVSSAPVFKPLHDYATELFSAIVRDLGRCMLDPLASPQISSHSGPSRSGYDSDVFDSPRAPMSSSPVREAKRRGMNDHEIRHARDLYTVCHGAMRLLSNMLCTPALCDIFAPEQLSEMLTHVVAIPLADNIPTPNSRKTYALAIFVLQTQRLPLDVLQPAAPRLTFAFRRALDGELGKEGKKGAITDALKAISEHLGADPSIFVEPFLDLFPSVLQNVLSPNASVRSQCVNTLGSFAAARTVKKHDADAFGRLAGMLKEWVDDQATAEGALNDLLARTLRVTAASESLENKVTGPIWSACVLASIIVLAGPGLFKHQRCVKLAMDALAHLTKHKSPIIKSVGRLVWRALVWAFVELQRTTDDAETDPRQLVSVAASWKMVRQVSDHGVGVATVAAVLQSGGAAGVSRALDIIERMLASGQPRLHEQGSELLAKLTDRARITFPAATPTKILLCPALFDGEFMNQDLETIQKTLVRTNRGVASDYARPLSDEELEGCWERVCGLWSMALFASALYPGNVVAPQLLDTWRALLVVRTRGESDKEPAELDEGARRAVTDVVTACLTAEDTKPEQRCGMAAQLWDVTRAVLPSSTCTLIAQAVLAAVAELDVAGEDDDVLEPWATLMAGLLAKAPRHKMQAWLESVEVDAKRRLWRALSCDCNADKDLGVEGDAYERAVALATAPFAMWPVQGTEWGVWTGVVATAVQRGKAQDLSVDEVVDGICEGVSVMVSDLYTLGEIVQRMMQMTPSADEHHAISAPSAVFATIGRVLEGLYSTDSDDIDACLNILHAIWEWLRTASSTAIVPFLEATHAGLAAWLRDEDKILSEDQYTDTVQPVYTALLNALAGVPMSLDLLESYATFLAAPAVDVEVSAALHKFWSHVVDVLPEARANCPRVLRSRLLEVAEAGGEDFSSLLDTIKGERVDVEMVEADEEIVEESLILADDAGSDWSWDVYDDDDFEPESRSSAVSEDLGCDSDDLDWSHQTAENLARLAGSSVSSAEDATEAALLALSPSPAPQTPKRDRSAAAGAGTSSSPSGVADMAFVIESSGASTSAAAAVASGSTHQSRPSVLGKRRRASASTLDVRPIVSLPRPDFASAIDNADAEDSIIEESISVELSQPKKRRATMVTRTSSSESPFDSPISIVSDPSPPRVLRSASNTKLSTAITKTTRSGRILDRVELPTLPMAVQQTARSQRSVSAAGFPGHRATRSRDTSGR